MVNMIAMPLIEVDKKATLTGHRDCIYTLEKAGVSNQFFSSGGDGMVVLWDINNPEEGELIAKVENSVYALAFLHQTNQLFIGQNFRGVHLIDIASKKELYSTTITTSYIFDIQLLDDLVLVGTGEGYLIVLSSKDLTTITKVKVSNQSIRSIAVSADKKQVVVCSSDNSIRIIDSNTFAILKEIQAHENSVFTVCFSPDGKYLLSGSRDAHLKVWNVANGYELEHSIVAHMFAINHIAYHPKEAYFATCSMDKSIKIWDANSFQLLKVIDKARHAGHATSINKLFWSSHQDLLLSGSDDRTITAWDIKFV